MGCTWDKDENGEPWLYPYGGHSILRTICQGVGGGSNVTGPLSEKLGEMGVNVETERMLVQLVQNDEGRVIGAVVRDGASDNDVESGKPVAIHATKGVVLATGGFGRDLEFRLAQDPRLDETVDCTRLHQSGRRHGRVPESCRPRRCHGGAHRLDPASALHEPR